MITDKILSAIIKVVAETAYDIAIEGRAPSSVCLQLEELSDDETIVAQLVDKIREEVDDLSCA